MDNEKTKLIRKAKRSPRAYPFANALQDIVIHPWPEEEELEPLSPDEAAKMVDLEIRKRDVA